MFQGIVLIKTFDHVMDAFQLRYLVPGDSFRASTPIL
jgi:hypothetical protein